jgi:hypothetical protein
MNSNPVHSEGNPLSHSASHENVPWVKSVSDLKFDVKEQKYIQYWFRKAI